MPCEVQRDGWRVARRGELRRPGAHPTNRDCYLVAILQANGMTNPFTDPYIADKLFLLKERLDELKRAAESMEEALQDVVSGRIRPTCGLHREFIDDEWRAYWYARRGSWGPYLDLRNNIPSSHWTYAATPPEELDRLFEQVAAPWDFRHRRILALYRKLARVVLGRSLRQAVAQRAIALYWQEATQRALCAPGGAGRTADEAAFASEF